MVPIAHRPFTSGKDRSRITRTLLPSDAPGNAGSARASRQCSLNELPGRLRTLPGVLLDQVAQLAPLAQPLSASSRIEARGPPPVKSRAANAKLLRVGLSRGRSLGHGTDNPREIPPELLPMLGKRVPKP